MKEVLEFVHARSLPTMLGKAGHCSFCGQRNDVLVKGDTGAMICDACIVGLAKR